MTGRELAVEVAFAKWPSWRKAASWGLKSHRWTSQVSYQFLQRYWYCPPMVMSLGSMKRYELGSKNHRLQVALVDPRDANQILLPGCCRNLMEALLDWSILRDQVMGQAPRG